SRVTKQTSKKTHPASDILDCFLRPHANKRTIKFTPDYRTPRTLPINKLRQIIHQLQTAQLRNITKATTRIRQTDNCLPSSPTSTTPSPPARKTHRTLSPTVPAQSPRQQSRIRPNELQDLLAQRRASTEPYNKLTHLAVFAAREYAPNDIIAGCKGSFADLTKQEDLKLRSNAHLPLHPARAGSPAIPPRESTDFSHIVNSRGKGSMIV
ncbi:hypothetical protein PTTG_07417, partial [Puccinia triticina 1-1 BBBD Race 1]